MKQNQIIALALLFLCVLAVSACTSSSAMTGNSSWPGITAEDDIVYTANGGLIEAVQDGKKLWSYPESANNRVSYYAAPAVDDKYVYAGTYTNQLHIINKADGTSAASVEVGNNKNKIIAGPIVADGNVIVLSSGGMVSSYPAEGSESLSANWQTTLSSELWVKPVYENGVLYVASMDKKMNLLDAANGTLIRSIDISGAIMSDPVLADGKLYFSTLAKEVDEMDLESGTIRTLLTTEGEIWASPLLMGDKLIAADMNGILYCVEIETAESVWQTARLTEGKIGFIASPVALDDNTILLIAEDGETMTYDLDGKSIGQRTMSVPVYSTPVVMNNGSFAVLPMAADAQIRTYTADLKEDWVYTRSDKADSKTESTPVSTEESKEAE